MSTGPTSFAGKMAVSAAASQRMAAGQRERALRGFFRWLDAENVAQVVEDHFYSLELWIAID
jgi:hypothetical protein